MLLSGSRGGPVSGGEGRLSVRVQGVVRVATAAWPRWSTATQRDADGQVMPSTVLIPAIRVTVQAVSVCGFATSARPRASSATQRSADGHATCVRVALLVIVVVLGAVWP